MNKTNQPYVTPHEFDMFCKNEEMNIINFDAEVNPGPAGGFCHEMAIPNLKKIIRAGIINYPKLQEEVKLIDAKKSKLGASARAICKSQYEFYQLTRRKSQAIWDKLTDEEKMQVLQSGGYIYE